MASVANTGFDAIIKIAKNAQASLEQFIIELTFFLKRDQIMNTIFMSGHNDDFGIVQPKPQGVSKSPPDLVPKALQTGSEILFLINPVCPSTNNVLTPPE